MANNTTERALQSHSRTSQHVAKINIGASPAYQTDQRHQQPSARPHLRTSCSEHPRCQYGRDSVHLKRTYWRDARDGQSAPGPTPFIIPSCPPEESARDRLRSCNGDVLEGDGVAHTAAGSAIVSVLERCACISDRSPCLQSHRLRARLQSSAAC